MSEKETKRERFIRLTEYRMNRLLKNVAQLGNLSTSAQYEFTTDDVDKIVDTLIISIRDMQERFSTGAPDVSTWTLDS